MYAPAITPDHTIEHRLARLERQAAWLKLALVAISCIALFGMASPPSPLTTTALTLVDDQGRVRAELALRDSTVGLFLRDEEGHDRLVASHDAEETGLFLKDEAAYSRVGVAQFAHGGGGVALHGPEARGAAVLYYKDGGSLRFFDVDGKVTNQVTAAGADAQTSH